MFDTSQNLYTGWVALQRVPPQTERELDLDPSSREAKNLKIPRVNRDALVTVHELLINLHIAKLGEAIGRSDRLLPVGTIIFDRLHGQVIHGV